MDGLDFLRQEAANYDRVMQELREDGYVSESVDPRAGGLTTKDTNVFHQLMAENHVTIRKPLAARARSLLLFPLQLMEMTGNIFAHLPESSLSAQSHHLARLGSSSC